MTRPQRARPEAPARRTGLPPAPAVTTPVRWLPPAALVLLVLIAYANSLHGGFVLDNRPLILQDPRVHDATWDNIRHIFTFTYWWPLGEHGLYRPLAKLTYLFNYAILGNADRPEGYHSINLGLHAANVLLLFALARRWMRSASSAFAVAAIWAVHPLLTEDVTNIIGRADLLAAAGILAGIWCFDKARSVARGAAAPWLAGLALAATVAIFSKESAVVLPVLIVLQSAIAPGDSRQRPALIWSLIAIAVPFLAFFWLRAGALAAATAPEFHFVDNPIGGASFLLARLTALRAVARYASLALWPSALSNDYSYAQIPLATGSAADWAIAIAIVAVTAAAIWASRRKPAAAWFAGLTVVSFVPISNLVLTSGTIMAERLLYLPLAGAVGWLIASVDSLTATPLMRRVGAAVVGILIVCSSLRTVRRNQDWHDDVTIWRSAVQSAAQSFETHRGLAVSLQAADPAKNLDAAIAEMDTSLSILNDLPDRLSATDAYADAGFFYQQLGDRLARTGANERSLAAYRRSRDILTRGVSIDRAVAADYVAEETARGHAAESIAPVGLPMLYERLALTDLRLGLIDDAIQSARHAVVLEPLLPDSHQALAFVLVNAGRPREAAVAWLTYYLIAGDARTVDALRSIYDARGDPGRCAFSATGLNVGCPIVHEDLCGAAAALAGIYRENRRPDLSDAARQRAAQSYGCRLQ